jgi:hypothetical protein
MRKRVQRKPVKVLREKAVIEPLSNAGLNIQEAVTILGGITGLIVAILWLSGRFYTAGYFGAMNIPAFQINFSVWEYAEVAWSRLLFYFLEKIYVPLTLITVVSLISFLSIFVLQRLFPRLKLIDLLNRLTFRVQNLPGSFRSLLVFLLVMYFISAMLDTLIEIKRSGQDAGRAAVLKGSYAVDVYSRDGIPLGSSETAPNILSTFNHYSGLRLLTYNNGKYYLFRELNPTTCKPAQVFVITDSQDVYFVFGNIAPMDTSCSLTSTSE